MNNKYTSLNILDKLESETVEKLLSMPIKILCKNFFTEHQEYQSLNILYKNKHKFWKDKKSTWSYYILEDDILKYSVLDKNKEAFHSFTEDYVKLLALSHEKRIEQLCINKQNLQKISILTDKQDEEISEVVVTGTSDTIMLNKVIFDDLKKLSPEKAKIKSKSAVDETSEIVKITSKLLSEYSGGFSIFSQMIEHSNGSTIKHMTRTFVMTLSFIKYYNTLLNSGYAAKVRGKFNRVYKDQYEKILLHEPTFNYLTLERVFKGGMAAIPELEINSIGIGFLLHDLGKNVDLEYFEGSESYSKDRIEAHVTNGFNELLKRTVYPPVVSAIAGLHHDYYGDKSGYGPIRNILARKYPDGIQSEYFISYSLKDVYNGDARCFFPAKILEIVDVYDAITDPERKYRAPLKPTEALIFIRDNFLSKYVKLDPVLFDMFKLYLVDAGEIAC